MSWDDDDLDAEKIDLGDHAEGRFDAWLRDVGLMATPPRKDKKGWDFYVDLPAARSSSDSEPNVKLNCAVQVKGQWFTTEQPPLIKLSNWKRMISEPIPWFVFVLLYERPRTPIRAALVHIDKGWIERVMERIWTNKAGANEKLHKLSMRVTWHPDDVLEPIDDKMGDRVTTLIRRQIGDPAAYVLNKIKTYKQAGIGRVKESIEFTLREDSIDYKRLVDVALGDADEIPVTEIVTSEVRFGVAIRRGPTQVAKLTLRPQPLPSKATITFTSTKPMREEFDIEFDVYSATGVFPFLPAQYRRLRLVAPLLRLEIGPGHAPGTTAYRWNLRVDESGATLEQLVQAARAFRILIDPTTPLPELRLFGKKATIHAKADAKFEAPSDGLELIEATMRADAVARSFGFRLDQITVRPRDLLDERQELKTLADLFAGGMHQAALTLTGPTTSDLDGVRVAYVTATGARLGDRYLIACVGFTGVARQSLDNSGSMSITSEVQILERKTVPVGTVVEAQFVHDIVAPMVERGEQRFKEDGLHLVRAAPDET